MTDANCSQYCVKHNIGNDSGRSSAGRQSVNRSAFREGASYIAWAAPLLSAYSAKAAIQIRKKCYSRY